MPIGSFSISYHLFVDGMCSGVPYKKHPDDVDTVASKVIGKIMTPAFWIQEKIQSRKSCRAQ